MPVTLGRWFLLIPALLVLAAGCGAAASPTWATVDGQTITEADVTTRLHLLQLIDPQAAAQLKTHQVKVQVVQEMVSEQLLLAAAKQAKVTVSSKTVKNEESLLANQLASLYPSSAARTKAMDALHLTQKDLDSYAGLSAVLQAYVQKSIATPTITQAEIASYYASHKAVFTQPEEYDVRHILVKTKALADTLLAELHKGASFSLLAKKYSIDTASAKNGGDLGYAPLSTYVSAFANAVAALKIGEISPVVHSPYGYHIIQLVATKPGGTMPLQAVSSQIQSYLLQQAERKEVQDLIAKLRAKARIKLSVPAGA